MRVVVVSDTHGQHDALGELEGDLLIHCGDFCFDQSKARADLDSLDRWFSRQRFRLIVCTGGNHDFLVEECERVGGEPFRHAFYLRDRNIRIDGLKLYGAPWVPELATWAYYRSESALADAWRSIPEDTDILVTHTPPFGVLDSNSRGKHCGCRLLLCRLEELRPRLHCFGHVHASAGTAVLNGTTYVNASLVNSRYQLVRSPIELDFD